MYRKFKLYNSLEETYDLTNPNKKAFFYAPTGLGFAKEIIIEPFDKSDNILSETYTKPQISGEMLFYGNTAEAYEEYLNFVNFIANSPLKLEYLPPNTIQPYYLDCVVSLLEKSEVSEDGVLHCPITFLGISLWQRSDVNHLIMEKITNDGGKVYPLEYPYYYQSSAFGEAEINVRADLSIPFELYINGNVTNPRLSVSQNGIMYGIIQLSGEFDSVYINTDKRDESMRLTLGNAILVNPYNYQDFSVVDGVTLFTFFDLKVGKNKIEFNCQNINDFDGTVELVWKDIRSTL